MTDFDVFLGEQLELLVPRTQTTANWLDVLRRAHEPLWRRPIVLAVALALLVLGTAAGVTAALGGFDAWLSGTPGKPAPKAEQRLFEAANGRSWAAFPKDTKLRELIRTTVAGKTYVLFGFRSGNTLCLKLRAITLRRSTEPACTPVSTLAHSTAPIVLVTSDFEFQDAHARTSAEFSFGIVTDGVSHVDVRAVDGMHRAVIGGNAYLFVEDEPNSGNRVLSIAAVGPDGRRTTLSLGTTFGDAFAHQGSPRPPRGPTRVAAGIRRPRIGWYLRGEKRGFSQDRLDPHALANLGVSQGARFVKPDPLSDLVIGLDGTYCIVFVEGVTAGKSCSPASDFFSRAPFNVVMSGGGGLQSMAVTGAAADGVVRLELFSADGQRLAVPLRDNLFAARASVSELPLRLVAYDARGRIVGLETLRRGLAGMTLPASAFRALRPAVRVTGPTHTRATLRIGHAVRGVRCWQVDFNTGDRPRGCLQLLPTGPWIAIDLVQPAGGDLFVIGQSRPPVATVELHFDDGRVLQTRPVSRLFVLPIPRAYVGHERRVAFAVGYDKRHQVVQRAGIAFRLP